MVTEEQPSFDIDMMHTMLESDSPCPKYLITATGLAHVIVLLAQMLRSASGVEIQIPKRSLLLLCVCSTIPP